MPRSFLRRIPLLVLFAVLLQSCGGKSPQAAAKQMTQLQAEFVGVLKKIKDSESAKQAVDRVDQIVTEMIELRGEMGAMQDVSLEEQRELTKQMMEDETTDQMARELERVMDLPGVEPVLVGSIMALTAPPK